MSRTRTGRMIELTERDLRIFQLLARYRFLRSTHLFALVGGKSQKRFIERLGHLYHEGGYLNRPQQQWQAINARYMPAVYELGEMGWETLRRNGFPDEIPSAARQHVVRQYHHELMICDILSSIELGVRADPNLRFIPWQEILNSPKMPEATRYLPMPNAVPVSVSYTCPRTQTVYRSDKSLIPDAIFGIEYGGNDQKQYRFFALEADRNTEPVIRRNLDQSSYLRKILQYREIAVRAIYRAWWGLPNLLVLNVTTSTQHLLNLMSLIDELTAGNGSRQLLFKVMPPLASLESAPLAAPDMLASPWQRVGHGPLCIAES